MLKYEIQYYCGVCGEIKVFKKTLSRPTKIPKKLTTICFPYKFEPPYLLHVRF